MKSLKLVLTFLLFAGLFSITKLAGAYQYPIPELGNCRDQQECHLYCELPMHKAACWSYSVYGVGGTVLADETPETKVSSLGLTFPIPELGSCASLTECKAYCDQPQNVEACQIYRKSKAQEAKLKMLELAKVELGCTSSQECHTFCTQEANIDTCKAFFNKYNLKFVVKKEVFEKAKAELGCTDNASCRTACELPENQTKCQAFAKKNKLENPRERLVEAAKAELGCTSFTDCREFCQNKENADKCKNFGQGLKLRQENQLKEKLGCTTAAECKTICEASPEKCPGFPNRQKSASPSGDRKEKLLNRINEKKGTNNKLFGSGKNSDDDLNGDDEDNNEVENDEDDEIETSKITQ